MGKIIRPLRILLDLFFLNMAYLITFFISFGFSFSSWNNRHFLLLLIFYVSWLGASFVTGVYNISRTLRMDKTLVLLFKTFFLYFLIIQTFVTLSNSSFPRSYILLLTLTTMIAITLSEISGNSFIKYFRSNGRNYKPMIIVGYGDLSIYLRKKIGLSPEFGYRYLGFFSDGATKNKATGTINEVIPFLEKEKVSEIYCYPAYVDPGKLKKIIRYAEDHLITVKIIPDYRGYQYSDMGIEMIDDIPVLRLKPLPLEDDVNRFWKRTFDLIICFFTFIFVLSWLFPIIALAIKLTSKGPVFFRQERGGLGNQPFLIYKFRTMYVHDDSEVKQASKDDSRITKIGAFLRKSSIDELPQILNVFLGDMSIVGPRPHALKHNKEFGKYIKYFNERHAVKPGITGLAQAKGFRGEIHNQIELINRIKMDRFYVKKWTFLLDIKIILLTALSLLKGQDTAY